MMNDPVLFRPVTDRAQIERFLRRDPGRHLYALGDLDDFFWPRTTWFGAFVNADNRAESGSVVGRSDRDALRELVLLYRGNSLPTILAFSAGDDALMRRLCIEVLRRRPEQYYAHLSVGLVERLREHGVTCEDHGLHQRMMLRRLCPARGDLRAGESIVRLGADDLPAIERLLAESYPGNWFDPAMLATGQYYGVRAESGGALVTMAGVHVVSASLRVAAIGNVTTHPTQRGRGLAAAVVSELCRNLAVVADHVGLNVAVENAGAIGCYERLGFVTCCQYNEVVIGPMS